MSSTYLAYNWKFELFLTTFIQSPSLPPPPPHQPVPATGDHKSDLFTMSLFF